MMSILHGLNRRLRSQFLIALALVALFCVSSARADYPVQAGDVVELSIGGVIEVHQRSVVQLDGTVTFPQVGTVSVTGLSAAEIRTKIQAALLGKTIRQRSPDGRVISFTIAPDDVAASVVEYRPVYVMGDVSKPGQHPFQPAMTAQQAVALSGGYDLLHMGNQSASLEASDLKSEYDGVMVQLAGLALRETRVKAELAHSQTMDETLPPDVQVPAATLSALVHAEKELFDTRHAEFEFEKSFFERSLKQTEDVMAGLQEQMKQEGNGAVADESELEVLQNLQKKGYASNVRVTDSRHAVSLAAARKMQITMQLDQAQLRKEEFQKQLARLETQRKIALLTDLKDDSIKQIELRAKLRNVRDKLGAISMTRAPVARGNDAQSPKIVVVRKGQMGRERLSVDEDFELQPADVVKVTIGAYDPSREVAAK
jgi:polysaccharide export outer membrane protein